MAKGLFKPATPEQVRSRPNPFLEDTEMVRAVYENWHNVRFTDAEWIEYARSLHSHDPHWITALNDDLIDLLD